MTQTPAPYRRALAGRDRLRNRFEKSCEQLKHCGRGSALRSFRAILSRGRAAINMPIPKLVRFLEEGGYLNIYELVARETGLTGEDLDNAVEARLRDLGPLRRRIDRLFHFQPDTHYAALNLGGAGALRYGRCCVVFDLRHWAPFHTCYAGDSIRSCFLADRRPAFPEEEVLARFGIGEDLDRIATVHWEASLAEPTRDPCFQPGEVRAIVEAEDSILEIHLHGPVTRDRVQEVLMLRNDYRHLRDLVQRAKGHSSPLPWEFDEVEPFHQMLELLESFEIPLVLAEG
jgi:hypothetical protein